jgi:branched-chain amino acid transport system ATP-binding protein
MLDTKGLRSGYGLIPILHGIELRVETNEFVGILGHNGMGKSTFLKTLSGLLPATGGRIIFEGTDITEKPPHHRSLLGIGYVMQEREIFTKLTVLENLRIGAVSHHKDKSKINSVVEQVIEEIPRLKNLLSRLGGVLSGGEQQILALARCLCGSPRLLMLDEPTLGIQPSIIEELIETLRALRTNSQLTVIMVEQNLDFIAALSDRVHVMTRGRITQEIPTAQISDPEAVSEYLGMGGTKPKLNDAGIM